MVVEDNSEIAKRITCNGIANDFETNSEESLKMTNVELALIAGSIEQSLDRIDMVVEKLLADSFESTLTSAAVHRSSFIDEPGRLEG